MSAQIICSGLAQAALWATIMPTITATCVPSIDPPSLSVTAVRVLLFVSRTKAEARR